MPNVPEAATLLVGQQVQPPVDQFEYDGDRRTDKVRAKKVLIMGDVDAGGGMSEVSIPLAELGNVRLGVGLSVVWYVRATPYSGSGGAANSVRFVKSGDENSAQRVHEAFQHSQGVADAGRRAAS